MAIDFVRIDDRLVHGQVVEGWIPYLKAERVVVVCDQAAQDPTQQALMRLALPDSVELDVLAISEVAQFLRSERCADSRILVLVPSPKEALALVKEGLGLQSINVGGLHYSAGRIQLGKVIFLSEEDRRTLKEIAEKGVLLEGRAVPSDRKMDVAGLLAGA